MNAWVPFLLNRDRDVRRGGQAAIDKELVGRHLLNYFYFLVSSTLNLCSLILLYLLIYCSFLCVHIILLSKVENPLSVPSPFLPVVLCKIQKM